MQGVRTEVTAAVEQLGLLSVRTIEPAEGMGLKAALETRFSKKPDNIDDQDVHQGFHINHRDAGTVGLVRLSFDAGFFFEGPDRGVLRWRADYRDDVRQLATEGGEAWLDRHQVACF